jgi:hypothetical protein
MNPVTEMKKTVTLPVSKKQVEQVSYVVEKMDAPCRSCGSTRTCQCWW